MPKANGSRDAQPAEDTSAHANGIRATIFSRKDLGIGYLAGEGDDPQITRTFYVDFATAERDWAWSEDLVEQLAATKPALYAGGTPTPSPAPCPGTASTPASSTAAAPTGAGPTAAGW